MGFKILKLSIFSLFKELSPFSESTNTIIDGLGEGWEGCECSQGPPKFEMSESAGFTPTQSIKSPGLYAGSCEIDTTYFPILGSKTATTP